MLFEMDLPVIKPSTTLRMSHAVVLVVQDRRLLPLKHTAVSHPLGLLGLRLFCLALNLHLDLKTIARPKGRCRGRRRRNNPRCPEELPHRFPTRLSIASLPRFLHSRTVHHHQYRRANRLTD